MADTTEIIALSGEFAERDQSSASPPERKVAEVRIRAVPEVPLEGALGIDRQ